MVTSSTDREFFRTESFPDQFGAVFVKELRQGLRAQRFVAPFLAIHGLAILVLAFQFLVKNFTDTDTSTGLMVLGISNTAMIDKLLLILLWLIIGIVMPLTGINSLRSELGEGRNVELLAIAGLDRWQIMRGKWLVLCALSSLIMISMLPYMLTLYFSGGVELVEQSKQFCNVWIFNLVMSAAVIGSSGFRSILARLATVFLVWLSYLITISIVSAPFSLIAIARGAPSPSLLWQSGVFISQALVIALYAKYGLQLGRGSLTIYERPVDPPLIGTAFLLVILTPIIAGFVHLMVGPVGSIILLGFLLKMDPSPDNKKRPLPAAA